MTRCTMKFYVGFLISLAGIISSCNNEHTTVIKGKVINWGSKQPIDSVTVGLSDGINSSSLLDFETSSGKRNITLTNLQGEFEVSITGEYEAFLSAGKLNHSFDPDWTDGISVGVRGYDEGTHKNVLLELKSHAHFNGVFIKRSNAQPQDTFLIAFYPDGWPIDKPLIEYRPPHIGVGPFRLFSDESKGRSVTGDTYLRFVIDFRNGSRWNTRIDSIYIHPFVVNRDTIYY